MNKKTYLKSVIFILTLFFSITLSAQSETEVLKNWTALEEAEFHYDVSYTVVKCTPSSKAIILINAFNEDGTNAKVGFTFAISDAAGNTAQVIIAPFASKLGDMFIANCNSEEHSNLKFEVPAGIDTASIKIEITYQTES
ncbi:MULTISPECIES: hypothetical protein [unclassified Polaribacter]|jgi:hypothetical protein|uniref:hypothetical protein n=1 Tax=unclassified Polaribacter TaxID=196858 RepID=UPI00052BA63F|nr:MULTISPECIES: hypothetical protein [unclassified Polaribacter]KGL61657.1 hypothetical protein PHEL49_2567 [Polaribacter sp. Hel1_33_49]PKV64375.1 hypothetical protein ATE90_0757 [Polaribacter sp. Hel1_33_96]